MDRIRNGIQNVYDQNDNKVHNVIEVSEAELTFPDITYTKVIRLKETKPLDVYPHIKK